MEVRDQLDAQVALFPGIGSRVGPRAGMDVVAKRKKSLPLMGN